jgi:predicted phosphodiesterase
MELTTVGDDVAVVHDGTDVRRYEGLEPDTVHELDGFAFRTLARPGGELLCRFATVNDVHFGETVCGMIEGLDMGPIFSSAEGEPPYPETMNAGAIAEISGIDPEVVVVKGDLTSNGTREEYDDFLRFYGPAFGDRLVHVRGNHESYHRADFAAWPTQRIDLPGVVLAVLDTAVDGGVGGLVSEEQEGWLDDVCASADRPVLVFGHHHNWNPESSQRPDNYFGIAPDDSERLVELAARRPRFAGYFAGHTHRNRVRRFSVSGDVPWVEVASVKDYPGGWAEYRVFEGGILQVFHRISAPEALVWTEKTRQMYAGTYGPYAFGELADRCFTVTAG